MRLGAAIAGVVLAAPVVASAEVTSSQVTAPASPYYALNLASEPETVTVAGTAESTDPAVDTVDLVCAAGSGVWFLTTGVALAPDGSFSAEVNLDEFPGQQCFIRALPAGSNFVDAPTALKYTGPLAAVSDFSTTAIVGGPNDGKVRDFAFRGVGFRATFDVEALGNRGLFGARAYADGLESGNVGIDFAFGLNANNLLAPATSSILVDGTFAYSTYSALERVGWDDQIPGLPGITVVPSVSPTGAITLVETSDLVRCNDQASCTEFVPTGVRLERTYRASPAQQGRQVIVRDRFISTDAAAHEVRADYPVRGGTSEYGYSFDGSETYQRYSRASTPLSPTQGPLSGIGREIDDEPGVGQEDNSHGGTWRTPPDLVVFTSDPTNGSTYVARNQISVPAGGQSTREMGMTVGWGMAQIRDSVLDLEEQWSRPTVAISWPAAGASLNTDWALVTGTSTGPRALGLLRTPKVSVNGVTAAVAPDGTWTAVIGLQPGANTVTATATNSAGETATSSRTVTYIPQDQPPPAATTSAAAAITPAPVAARGLTRGIRRQGKRVVNIGGKLLLRPAVTRSQACTGWVRLSTRRGKRVIRTDWAPLRPTCTYRIKMTLPARGRVTTTVRFTGNRFVRPVNARPIVLAARR